MIAVEPQRIAEVLLLTPDAFPDARGVLVETYRAETLAAAGFDQPFIQENQSFTRRRGTLRGLHFQAPPAAQAKLVRVIRGAVFDVAVDLRRSSPTFGQVVSAELSTENRRQLLVPEGFAHGFVTLTDDTEVIYKLTARYEPAAERGLLWSDPALGIEWPLPLGQIEANPRDSGFPILAELASPF